MSANDPARHAAPARGGDPAPRMPSGILFIVANEFGERFCYYGINAVLSVFMTQSLLFTESRATVWQSTFKSAAYFAPMIGAVISDVFWGKFRTILVFSMAYCTGCVVLAAAREPAWLALGLGLMALGTGGIKPCVSTNVGDQFTQQNAGLIERAFSYFYLSINAGSLISILACPVLLNRFGPGAAFGLPAGMMMLATLVFYAGRKNYAVVPPAGRAWLAEVFSAEGAATVGRLVVIYFFVVVFWALWDQSNGTTWVLQARSSLMDKDLGFGIRLLPSQIQSCNALFILILVPIFSYGVYPLIGRVLRVTPLRKIGAGLFVTAGSFLVVAWIEAQIQGGHRVSVWWQILAYLVLTVAEVLVSITALEFSYRQAPLRMKSFVMALFLLSVSVGNLLTAGVNQWMVKPLQASALEIGATTWLHLDGAAALVSGQKIDFTGISGVQVQVQGEAKPQALSGTFLVGRVDGAAGRVELLDVVERAPLASQGRFDATATRVSTYLLVGPKYFLFFAALMAATALAFAGVSTRYRERTYVRGDAQPA